MKKRIYDYKLEISDKVQTILVLDNSVIIFLKVQDNSINLWMENIDCRPYSKYVKRSFKIYNPGDVIEVADNYLGTVFRGESIWHVYERYLDEDKKETP